MVDEIASDTGGTVIEEKREVVIPNKERGFQHWPQFILAFVLTVMVSCILYAEFFLSVPIENQRVIDNLSAMVFTVWMTYMGYFAHTTFGSTNKTSLIAKAGPVDPH